MPKKEGSSKPRKSERTARPSAAGEPRRKSVRAPSPAEAAPSTKEKKREAEAPKKPVRVMRKSLLTPAQLRDIRDALMTKLTELKRNVDRGFQGARDRDLAHIQDDMDKAADSAEGDLVLRIAENDAVEIAEVERAIEKIDNTTYGICEGCGEPISLTRLQFLPFATHCIECKKLRETSRRKEDLGEDEEEWLEADEPAPESREE